MLRWWKLSTTVGWTSNQILSLTPLLEHINDGLKCCERWSFSSDNKRSIDIKCTIFLMSIKQLNKVFTNTFVKRNNSTNVTLQSLICVSTSPSELQTSFHDNCDISFALKSILTDNKKMVWFLKPFLPFLRWLDTICICDLLSVFDCFPSPLFSPNKV